MEADKNLSAGIGKVRSGNNAIVISQASISLSTSLTEPCLYEKAGGEISLHQSNFTSDGQHLAVPRVTSGGSRRRECLKPAKKRALCRPERCAAQVLACLSTVGPPPPGGKTGTVFPDLVPGAGTLPVGFQGRSALVAPKGAKSPFRKLAHGVEY